MENSENSGKVSSRKPKYDPKLIGVIASENGSIKDIASKYNVSQYFVKQSRETARELGFRVYRDRLTDGEKEAIIDESSKGKSAREISQYLGGISTSSIYHTRSQFLNGYNSSNDNNVVSTPNLEARIVKRTGGVIRIDVKRKASRKAVGNGDEVVGINEFVAMNEGASEGTGESVPFENYSDEQIRRDYGGDPKIVRRNLLHNKKQLSTLSEEQIIEEFDANKYRSLKKQIDYAKSLKGGDPKGSISLLEDLLSRDGAIPHKSKFGQIRTEAEEALTSVRARYHDFLAAESAKKAAVDGQNSPSLSGVSQALNQAAAKADAPMPAEPAEPLLVVPVGEPVPEPAVESAPEVPVEQPAAEVPAIGPMIGPQPNPNPEQPAAESAPEPAAGEPTSYPVSVDPRALEIVGRRYVNPDMAVVAEVADRYNVVMGDEADADAKSFFSHLDGKFERTEPTSEEFDKAHSLNERYSARESWLLRIISDGDKVTNQKGRKNEIKALNSFIEGMDDEKREEVFEGLIKQAYQRRAKTIQACTLSGRFNGWCDRNYKYLLTGALAGLAGVAAWAGLEGRLGTVEQRQDVPTYVGVINKVEGHDKLLAKTGEALEKTVGLVETINNNQRADEAALKKLGEDMAAADNNLRKADDGLKKADNDNLKLVKDRFDLETSERKNADSKLDAQQKGYELENKKTDDALSARLQSIADAVNAHLKQAAQQPKPVAEPQPAQTPSPGPVIGPQPNPNPEQPVKPEVQTEKNYEGETSIRAEGLSGDASGHQLRATTLFSLGNEYQFKIDALERSEKLKLDGEDVRRKTLYATPEFTITKDNGLYEFNFKGNHAQSSETRDGKSRTSDLTNEAGLSILTEDNSAWRQRTDKALNSFSFDAKAQKFHLFGDASSNRTETGYNGDTNVTVSEAGNAFPPFVVNNDVRTTTESTTNTFKGGAGWDFGEVEPGIIARHSSTDWDMKSRLNGATILDKDGSSTQDTLGTYVRFNFDNKVAGRATLLHNSGDDLKASQETEFAAHGTFLLGDNFAFSAGGEKSDGGAKARGAILWKTNENKTGADILQETNNFVNSAEEDNLFPETSTAEQKRWRRIDKDRSAGASGLFLAVEGGKEGEGQGNYFELDAAAPIPGTKGKAYVYTSVQNGDSFRFVEGGAGWKPNDRFQLGWNVWNSDDKENDVQTTGTGPTITVKW